LVAVTKKSIQFQANDLVRGLYGCQNCHLKRLESLSGVQIHVRGNVVNLHGEGKNVEKVISILQELYTLLSKGHQIQEHDIDQAWIITKDNGGETLAQIYSDVISINGGQRKITSKSLAQKEYIHAIRAKDIVFGIGPAGTGKTYLAIAMAVEYFHNRNVKKIILTRPAVEAGEKLGFLPGDLTEKVDPYLRPIYDCLYDMMESEKVHRLLEREDIEIAPLAFMRGRTLNDAFIILDEAQNTTTEQMKMFLTRVGQNTKAVITGDVTQIDLPSGKGSGLIQARELLEKIEGLAFCGFSEKDVVRHPLVREIIKAYENHHS